MPQNTPPKPPFDLADFIPYQLSVLSNRISAAIAAFYDEHYGLSVAQWRVIAVLARFAPMSAAQVCERTAMDKVAVSRAVAALKTRRLVTRATDPSDARRSVLRLSAGGERVHAGIVPVARAYEAALLSTLSGQQREQLNGILELLQQRALQLEGDASWREGVCGGV